MSGPCIPPRRSANSAHLTSRARRLCLPALFCSVLAVPSVGGAQDAQIADAGPRPSDAGPSDAGPSDAGPFDASLADAQAAFVPGPWSPPAEEERQAQGVPTALVAPTVGARVDHAAQSRHEAFQQSSAQAHEFVAPAEGEVAGPAKDAREPSRPFERQLPDSSGTMPTYPTIYVPSEPEPVHNGSELTELVSVVVDDEHSPAAYWSWLVLALLAWIVDRMLRSRSESFTDTGLLPSLQSIASLLWHGALLMAVLFFALRAIPRAWLPDLKWVFFGALLIVMWSFRGLLADLGAWLVIAIDGKVRPRLMVQTRELSGRVARIGFRQTDIVDAVGRTWALPNRQLLSAQVREPSETHVHASLILEVPNKRVIEDAALASAWIHPDGRVHVWRDASDTHLWHVETRLISNDFERLFRSDLAERVRERGRNAGRLEEAQDEAISQRPADHPDSV